MGQSLDRTVGKSAEVTILKSTELENKICSESRVLKLMPNKAPFPDSRKSVSHTQEYVLATIVVRPNSQGGRGNRLQETTSLLRSLGPPLPHTHVQGRANPCLLFVCEGYELWQQPSKRGKLIAAN